MVSKDDSELGVRASYRDLDASLLNKSPYRQLAEFAQKYYDTRI